jgi:hypothetical protein
MLVPVAAHAGAVHQLVWKTALMTRMIKPQN